MYYFERLSAQDTLFIKAESPTTPQHIGSVGIYDASEMKDEHGHLDFAKICRFIHSRLHEIPRYRQVIARVPVGQHPVWIDDPRFDLSFHVRHISVPRPGTIEQLNNTTSYIFSQRLDPGRPLWEIWVVEGLEDDRFALITKVHHSMLDGAAGMDLMSATHRLQPDDTIEEPKRWAPRPAPTGVQLLLEEASRRYTQFWSNARFVVNGLREPKKIWAEAQELGRSIVASGMPGTRTPLNQPIGPSREVKTTEISLEEVKAVKNALGGTVNDVLLAICAGMIRGHFEKEGVALKKMVFRAGIPVNLRKEQTGKKKTGNYTALVMVDLPLREADPKLRYEKIVEATELAKKENHSQASQFLLDLAEHTFSGIYTAPGIAATKSVMTNITITNVPGPQFPIYFLKAKLLSIHPLLLLLHNQALAIAFFSYMGRVYWGLSADRDTIGDLSQFTKAVHSEFDVLKKLAGVSPTAK